ncbi:MAG: NADH:ubiquinone reductase (Na(+)-transporting) subunit A [Muribaculaceae bacterium]|nr:NADH:ubiquinone reductase (Na(+)-transporting) subunit A [Muribaculaceae bacterium]
MDIKIKKGLDLKLVGGIENPKNACAGLKAVEGVCALCPEDFPGFKPKTSIKEGTLVNAGDAVLYNKDYETMALASPIDGKVRAVVRGDRRRILRVEIEPAKVDPATEQTGILDNADAQATVDVLASKGLLARFRERPYDVVPTAGVCKVRDIYVICFDSAPLAVDPAECVEGTEVEKRLAGGLEILSRLTDGKVYLAVRAGSSFAAIAERIAAGGKGIEVLSVAGLYPSSLPGSLISATAPLNKGERVWSLDLTTALRIGELKACGHYSFENTVAVVGYEVEKPFYAKACDGMSIKALVNGHLKKSPEHKRIISGNVFTGVSESEDGYLRFPYRQLTIIPEGDDKDEFMGWASLAPSKVSVNRSFPLSFMRKIFNPDARLNGGRRAMIMSGEYERYIPMDILPEYLIKAILAKDVEGMEKLGIYEVAPEDFALAEFADTSKLPLQQIVRDGLDYLRKELE